MQTSTITIVHVASLEDAGMPRSAPGLRSDLRWVDSLVEHVSLDAASAEEVQIKKVFSDPADRVTRAPQRT